MSLDTSHVALANEQQLQAMMNNPQTPMPAMLAASARLSKIIQMRKAQQNNAAMAEQVPPTVKEQLNAAAAPPPPTGIAQAAPGMAEGGMVQRHFEGGGQADTLSTDIPYFSPGTTYEDKMAEIAASGHQSGDMEDAWLKVPRALRDLISRGTSGIQAAMGNPTWSKLSESAQDLYTDKGGPAKQATRRAAAEHPEVGLAATQAARDAALPTSAGVTGMKPNLAAAKANPKAPTANPAPRAADQAGGAGEVLPSGPVNPTKIAAASAGEAPGGTYRDRADELLAKLDPLYAEQMAHIKRQGDTENERYAGLEAAQKKDGWRQLSDLGAQLMGGAYDEHGRPAATHGIADLARFGKRFSDDKLKQDTALNDQKTKHQIVMDGVAAGATKEQIGQAIAKYNLINSAEGADDKTELNNRNATIKEQAAELAQARLGETARLNSARINQLVAKTRAAGLGAAGGKPLSEAQALQHAAAAAAKDIKAIEAAGGEVPDRAQLTAAYYAKFKTLTHTGAIQSGGPAPVAGGAKFLGFEK